VVLEIDGFAVYRALPAAGDVSFASGRPYEFPKAFGPLGSASVEVDEHMTPRMGTLVSLSAGSLVGVIASFVPMIFGPLAFPQAMGSPTLGENIVAASIPLFFLLFGAIGFFITRKLIARFIAHGTDTNRTFIRQFKLEQVPNFSAKFVLRS
jgi:hypothetical protein